MQNITFELPTRSYYIIAYATTAFTYMKIIIEIQVEIKKFLSKFVAENENNLFYNTKHDFHISHNDVLFAKHSSM